MRAETPPSLAAILVLAAWVCWIPGVAHADTLFFEDFEALVLGPFVTEGGGDGTDWTATPPPGWVHDTSGMVGGGVPEFFGFTFLDAGSWAATAGDQRRSEFTLGTGTVMVADADEYEDTPVMIGPDGFNAFISTPAIDLGGVLADSVTVEFDSSWRPEDSQKANLTVSYDGAAAIEVLRFESDPLSPDFKDDAPNETLTIALTNPGGASEMVLTFGMFEAGNDWWWAVDNIQVDGEPVPEPSAVAMLGVGAAALGLSGLGRVSRRRRRARGPR